MDVLFLIWFVVAALLFAIILWFARGALACEDNENCSFFIVGMFFIALFWPYMLAYFIAGITGEKIDDWRVVKAKKQPT